MLTAQAEKDDDCLRWLVYKTIFEWSTATICSLHRRLTESADEILAYHM